MRYQMKNYVPNIAFGIEAPPNWIQCLEKLCVKDSNKLCVKQSILLSYVIIIWCIIYFKKYVFYYNILFNRFEFWNNLNFRCWRSRINENQYIQAAMALLNVAFEIFRIVCNEIQGVGKGSDVPLKYSDFLIFFKRCFLQY